MKEKINQKLEEIRSTIKIIALVDKYGEDIIRRNQKFDRAILSTGFVFFTLQDYQKFCRKVHSQNAKIYKFEELYSTDEIIRKTAELNLKSKTSSKNSLKGWKTISKESRTEIASNRAKKAWKEGKMIIPCKGWNKGLTKENCTSMKKMGEARTGSNNPMSKENIAHWSIEKQKSYRRKLSVSLKLAIEEGRFTPNIHNSNTHWTATYKGRHYRSSLEAAIASILDDSFIFEETRIRYFDGSEERIYIVDFTSHYHKKMIEIKPSSMIDKAIFKTEAACNYASQIEYQFEILTESFLQPYKDFLLQKKDDFSVETWKKIERYFETDI
jgi:hypothetical protein